MRISVKARPGASENLVTKIAEGQFEVWVKEPPIQGRANRAVIRLIAEYFRVPVVNVKIVSGFTLRNKILEIN